MPRIEEEHVSDGSIFSLVVEQGWLAFIVLGVFIVGLRLYNVRQRATQRKILRESFLAEMGYGTRSGVKRD